MSHCNDLHTESPSSSDDLGVIVAAANGSFESLRHQVQHLDDAIKYKLLTAHCSPSHTKLPKRQNLESFLSTKLA